MIFALCSRKWKKGKKRLSISIDLPTDRFVERIWRERFRWSHVTPRFGDGAKSEADTSSFLVPRFLCPSRPLLFPAHTNTFRPPPTPCPPSSPVPPSSPRSRLSPWPSATSPSAPPRPPSAYRASHPKFILLAPDRRRTSKRRDASTRTQTDIRRSPRSLRPRAIVNSGVTRRAAVAGVLALFVAQPVRLPDRPRLSDIAFPTREPPRRPFPTAARRPPTHPFPPPRLRSRVPSTSGLRRDQARAREGRPRGVQPLRRLHVQVRGLRLRQVQGPPRVPQGRAGGDHEGVRPRSPPRPVIVPDEGDTSRRERARSRACNETPRGITRVAVVRPARRRRDYAD